MRVADRIWAGSRAVAQVPGRGFRGSNNVVKKEEAREVRSGVRALFTSGLVERTSLG